MAETRMVLSRHGDFRWLFAGDAVSLLGSSGGVIAAGGAAGGAAGILGALVAIPITGRAGPGPAFITRGSPRTPGATTRGSAAPAS
jgi:hypothetical protein